jgi:hypothetical protein
MTAAPYHNTPLFAPQPLQELFLSSDLFEVLMGGGRGAGKSVALLADWVGHAERYGALASGLIVRRESTELRDLIKLARTLLRPLGYSFNGTHKTFTSPKGATLVFDHLWDESDAGSYQGWSLTWIGIEEAGEFPSSGAIDLLRATLRGAVPCYLRLTANPGGPGNAWLRTRFVDPAPRGYQVLTDRLDGVDMQRLLLPCTPYDNPINLRNNPRYIAQLRQIGSKEIQAAWILGQWNISVGQYFSDVWAPAMQILTPFEIPASWGIFRRGFDWGFEKPSAAVFGAIPDNDVIIQGRLIKRKSLVIFREWYPLARDAQGKEITNKGPRKDTDLQGEELTKLSKDRKYSGCVADPSIFPEKGAKKSTYSDLQEGARRQGSSLVFTPADNSRVSGWQNLRAKLRESAKQTPEGPGLFFFSTCIHTIRTMPALQRDKDNLDDIDSDGEDHLADALRYLNNTLGRSGGALGSFGG